MAFPDPLVVNIGAGNVNLPRTSTGQNTSTYTSADGNITVTVGHVYGSRARRTVRIDVRKLAADPQYPAQNAPYSMSFYGVVNVPKYGFSSTEVVSIASGLIAVLTASTNANLTKLAQGEN